MIIIMQKTAINDHAAQKLSARYGEIQYYPEVSLGKSTDSELIIIDLEGEGELQEKLFYGPDMFFSQLACQGFSTTFKAIDLLMPNAKPHYSLITFCQKLANILAIKFHKNDMIIRAPVHLMYNTRITAPDLSHAEWQVYGITQSLETSETAQSNGKLLWTDADPIRMLKMHAADTQFYPQGVG
ncbi:MAG: hypothetical protein A3E83_00280 [Gammaproteobacteria bacterium RIFCSPHIGHO2_12_FULL_41_20]|nr:MAG: hypothetical protein A3E83_00280 [Gammaproteobacteria bacterium RIFCSPHIGHO2_12_FULL_41_20]